MDSQFQQFFSGMIKLGNQQEYVNWLRETPKVTTYRVNLLHCQPEHIMNLIQEYLQQQKQKYNRPTLPKVYKLFSETVALDCWPNDDNREGVYDQALKDVIVDAACGSAVLRGANVYAPAVMGLPPDININDLVNIFADASGKCKQGLKVDYTDDSKVYIGLGILKMNRKQLYNAKSTKPKGIAIETIMPMSRVPVIDSSLLPEGSCLLQNLPSIICSKILQPKCGDTIIDMCAAPGNKTTHLAEIMGDRGIIIALDKTEDKINAIRNQCRKSKLKSVHPFAFDSTKAVLYGVKTPGGENQNRDVLQGPPFLPESFDKVLLDVPCSVLGQRPLIKLLISHKCLKSFVPLQRKLFFSAVSLLKPNGRLVYSTCTLRSEECEEMVAWALATFQCLKLIPAEPLIGNYGWPECGLDDCQRKMVQRFGPNDYITQRNGGTVCNGNDTIGFFIACFIKTS